MTGRSNVGYRYQVIISHRVSLREQRDLAVVAALGSKHYQYNADPRSQLRWFVVTLLPSILRRALRQCCWSAERGRFRTL